MFLLRWNGQATALRCEDSIKCYREFENNGIEQGKLIFVRYRRSMTVASLSCDSTIEIPWISGEIPVNAELFDDGRKLLDFLQFFPKECPLRPQENQRRLAYVEFNLVPIQPRLGMFESEPPTDV